MEDEGATKIQIIGYFKSPSAIMTEILKPFVSR
jgi:hypothetical protein